MRVLLSVDPGETTGYAVVELAPLTPENGSTPNVIERGIISTWHGLDTLIEEFEPEIIVVEKFMLYPHKARALSFQSSVCDRVIGVVHYLAEQREIPVYEQPAAVGKRVILPSAMVRRIRTVHERDAIKHASAFLRRYKWPTS